VPLRLAIPITLSLAATALAQPDPSGIDFVTIGNPGNAPWQGDGTTGDRAIGRGGVDYDYRIGRFEVTTAQFVEFFNAALDRPSSDTLPFVTAPAAWGAVSTTPNNPGGQRWTVPAGRGMIPVGGLDWRTCAMFCNWECNNRQSNRSSFMDGAYAASTFGYGPNGFTDQLVHNPGAQYWIPTWDEFLKASHYDPNRFGPGQGGWWIYSNGTNSPLAYGPPGLHVRVTAPYGPDPNGPLAQANAGWQDLDFPGYDPYSVSLGAYSGTQTPWGLFDTAGGTSEWSEEPTLSNGTWWTSRAFFGSSWAHGFPSNDAIYFRGGEDPGIGLLNLGFRIAAQIPSPSTMTAAFFFAIASARRRHRTTAAPGS
jgi:formylglycine-generating enzyme required for sulfatase activity